MGENLSPPLIFATMTKEKFLVILNSTLDKIKSLFDSKNNEYAETKDVFANFKKAASGISFHKYPDKVAWEYLTKHLQSIKDIIESRGTNANQDIDEKIDDAIMYLILIKGMLKESQAIDEILDKLYHKEDFSNNEIKYNKSWKYTYTPGNINYPNKDKKDEGLY